MEARSVSVIMPAYNVAGYVAEAMRSVEQQTWPRIHLIAIDDGSTDGTGDILESIATRWRGPDRKLELVRQANAGAAAARNTGLERVRSPLVAFLDADDRWHSELVSRLAATLDSQPDTDMTFPRYRYIDIEGAPIGVETRAPQTRFSGADLMIANPVHSATGVMLRAVAANQVGPFDTTLTACIDLDFWVRLAALRPRNIGLTDAVLADYRKRGGQITGDWRRMQANWERVLDKMARAGYGLTADQERRARARKSIYWATIAYQAGDYATTRRLMADSLRLDPSATLSDPFARIRLLAALASLLPERVHDGLRERFNARRSNRA